MSVRQLSRLLAGPLLTTLVLCVATSARGAEPPPSKTADASSTGWRGWLRECVACKADQARYGIQIDKAWQSASEELPVVVLVHGFNSTPQRAEPLLASCRAAGLPCAVFAYPNDQALAPSAELLSTSLKAFGRKCPGRRVALVTHSMGGLVARECIENDELNPANVDRLVMVAAPTHGSVLAHCALGLDLWEHWVTRDSGSPWQRTRDSIVDGLSEAPADLCPGSDFLTRLNARPRRAGVRYTLVLGSRAWVSEDQLRSARKSLSHAAWFCSMTEHDVEGCLAQVDEVFSGRGDGAVALSRARLEGVTDTVVLPFGHMTVVNDAEDQASREVQEIILNRVQVADEA
ncbi:MAG: alpha/beta hydrolase [Planctomycetales bacterium]|nr:alpha/beta hydrolase [Planctomycetales bacterium]